MRKSMILPGNQVQFTKDISYMVIQFFWGCKSQEMDWNWQVTQNVNLAGELHQPSIAIGQTYFYI